MPKSAMDHSWIESVLKWLAEQVGYVRRFTRGLVVCLIGRVEAYGQTVLEILRGGDSNSGVKMPGTPAELIADAKLIARYASLKGILPDQALLSKVAEAEQKLAANTWNAQIEQELAWEINNAVKFIAPLTVARLREEKNYHPARSRFGFRAMSAVLMLISFGTLIMLIPLTASYNQMKASLSSINELIDETNRKVDTDYNILARKLLQGQAESKIYTLTAEDLTLQLKWQDRQYKISVESQLAVFNLHYFEDVFANILSVCPESSCILGI